MASVKGRPSLLDDDSRRKEGPNAFDIVADMEGDLLGILRPPGSYSVLDVRRNPSGGWFVRIGQ